MLRKDSIIMKELNFTDISRRLKEIRPFHSTAIYDKSIRFHSGYIHCAAYKIHNSRS